MLRLADSVDSGCHLIYDRFVYVGGNAFLDRDLDELALGRSILHRIGGIENNLRHTRSNSPTAAGVYGLSIKLDIPVTLLGSLIERNDRIAHLVGERVLAEHRERFCLVVDHLVLGTASGDLDEFFRIAFALFFGQNDIGDSVIVVTYRRNVSGSIFDTGIDRSILILSNRRFAGYFQRDSIGLGSIRRSCGGVSIIRAYEHRDLTVSGADNIAFDLELGCLGTRNLFGNEREYILRSIVLSGELRSQRFGRNKEGHLALGARRQTDGLRACGNNDTAEVGDAIDALGNINQRLDAAGEILDSAPEILDLRIIIFETLLQIGFFQVDGLTF